MKAKLQQPTNKTLIFFLFLIIGLLVAILWDYGQKIDNLTAALNGRGTLAEQQESGLAWFPVKTYVQNELKGIYSLETVADPVKNVVYLPEVKISLPLNAESRDIRYNYQPADPTGPAQVEVSTDYVLNKVIGSFADVPCEQQMIGFSVDQKNGFAPGGQYAGSVKLADGRTLYFWENSTASCQKFWNPGLQADILSVLKKAQSY